MSIYLISVAISMKHEMLILTNWSLLVNQCSFIAMLVSLALCTYCTEFILPPNGVTKEAAAASRTSNIKINDKKTIYFSALGVYFVCFVSNHQIQAHGNKKEEQNKTKPKKKKKKKKKNLSFPNICSNIDETRIIGDVDESRGDELAASDESPYLSTDFN